MRKSIVASLTVAATFTMLLTSSCVRGNDRKQPPPAPPTFDLLSCALQPITVARSSPLIGASTIAGQWDTARPGVGFTYLTGQLAGDCVSATSALSAQTSDKPIDYTTREGTVCNRQLGTQTYKINFAENVDSLSRQLEMSASASGKGVAWSASAAASFVETYDVSTTSRFLLIEASVELRSQTGTKFELLPAAQKLLARNPAAFRNTCGDHYVRSVWYGGRFHAVYHFKTKTEEQAKELTASLRGSFSGGALKTAADLRSSLSKHSHSTSVEILVQVAGGGFQTIGMDPGALLERLDAFFCNIDPMNAPAVRVELAGYPTVDLQGRQFEFTGGHADVVADLQRLRARILAERELYESRARTLVGDCPDAAAHYSSLSAHRNEALQQLSNLIEECTNIGGECRRCSALATTAPKLDTEVAKCDPCGSHGAIGVTSGSHCRRCMWRIGDVHVPDSTTGERRASNTLIANRRCGRMEPNAPVLVRAKGSITMGLSNGKCRMTCLPDGEKTTVTVTGRDRHFGSRDYCQGGFSANLTDSFQTFALNKGADWWEFNDSVGQNGTTEIGLSILGMVYGCENSTSVNRHQQLHGVELEVCQVGYCN